MDLNSPLDKNLSTQLVVNAEMKRHLLETAKWAKFFSILMFISIGFTVLAALGLGLFMGTLAGSLPSSSALAGGGMGILFSLFYLVFAVLYYFPAIYLWRFSEKTKLAIAQDDQVNMAAAFGHLKSVYKFFGILTIILLGFYAIMLIVGLGAGMFG